MNAKPRKQRDIRQRNADALRGRTIRKVEMNAFRDERAGPNEWTYRPVIHFTDGSTLRMLVHETETGEYGIDLSLWEDE